MLTRAGERDNQAPPSVGAVFRAFLRLGLTAFGGPAMVPVIGEMVVERKQWLSSLAFRDGVALCQTIPGATAMQTAAYCGLRARGVPGAAVAYIGFGLPAFIVITILSAAYRATHSLPVSLALFRGLQVIVIAIIVRAVVTFTRATVHGWQDLLISLAAAAALLAGISPVAVIAAAAVAGVPLRRHRTGAADGGGASPDRHAVRLPLRPLVGIIVGGGAALVLLRVLAPKLCQLALLMLRIDLLAFGGGFASVPLMLHAVVDVKRWLGTRAFMDGIALGQVTPGPIVITATFVGYQVKGLAGAVIATAAIFTPSFVVLLAAVPYFDRLQRSVVFRSAMRGVLASFVGLLVSTAITFVLAAHWSLFLALLAGAAFVALMLKADLLLVVMAGGAAAALSHYVRL